MKHSGAYTAVGTVDVGGNTLPAQAGKTERTGCGRTRSLLGFGLAFALVWGVAGCHKTTAQNTANAMDPGDPANVNMAPVNDSSVGQPAQVLAQNAQYQDQQQGEEFPQQQAAPIERRYAGDQ